jgi:hypothetical protein
MLNVTLANTVGGPDFFVLWPFNQARPLASTVNWWASAQQPAKRRDRAAMHWQWLHV